MGLRAFIKRFRRPSKPAESAEPKPTRPVSADELYTRLADADYLYADEATRKSD